MVPELDALLLKLSEAAVERISDAQLGDELVALRRGIDRQEAEFVRRLQDFDRRGAFRADGSTSAVAWLRSRCGMSGGAAATRVEVARELESVPGASELFLQGGIGFDNAAALSRTAAEVGPEAARLAGKTLIDAATRLQPERCRNVGRQLRHTVDPNGALAQELRDYRRRRFSLSRARDGMYLCEGVLDPEGGAILRTALDALDRPLPGEQRTAAQRRHDALVELARRQLQAGSLPTHQGQRPQLVLTASAASLQDRPGAPAGELRYAGPISNAAARRIACDAAVVEITTVPAAATASAPPPDRAVPAWMRRALIRRDNRCRFTNCDRGPEWCDAHHIIHRADGGQHELPNLALLCRVHHRMVHEGGWTITLTDGRAEVRPPPSRN